MLNKAANIISSLLKGESLSNLLLINYAQDNIPKKLKTGYDLSIKSVIKRYSFQPKKFNLKATLSDHAVRDNLFFLEDECKDEFTPITKDKRFIDIGCGNGIYSKILKRKKSLFEKVQYSGCEFDKEMADLCTKLNPGTKFFVSHAEKIDSANNFYDFVFCSGMLHYSLSNWKKVIIEMKRVSKKYLIITRMPFSKYEKTFYVHQVVRGINGTENHYFIVPNRDDFEYFVTKNGLTIIKRDYSTEVYNVNGVGEKIMLMQYLLAK